MKTFILSFVALAATLAAATPLAQPEHCNDVKSNTRIMPLDYVFDLFKRSDFELEARQGPNDGGGTSNSGGGGTSGGGGSSNNGGGTSKGKGKGKKGSR